MYAHRHTSQCYLMDFHRSSNLWSFKTHHTCRQHGSVNWPSSFDSGMRGPCYLVFVTTVGVVVSQRHLITLLAFVMSIKVLVATKIQLSCFESISYSKGCCYYLRRLFCSCFTEGPFIAEYQAFVRLREIKTENRHDAG